MFANLGWPLLDIATVQRRKCRLFWGTFYLRSLSFSQQCFWELEVLRDIRPCWLVQSRRRFERALRLRIQEREKRTGSAWPWRWMQCFLSKSRQLFASHHGVASHKTWIFILLFPSSVSELKKKNYDPRSQLQYWPSRLVAEGVGWEKYDFGEREIK